VLVYTYKLLTLNGTVNIKQGMRKINFPMDRKSGSCEYSTVRYSSLRSDIQYFDSPMAEKSDRGDSPDVCTRLIF
jgi:hypothetical protein